MSILYLTLKINSNINMLQVLEVKSKDRLKEIVIQDLDLDLTTVITGDDFEPSKTPDTSQELLEFLPQVDELFGSEAPYYLINLDNLEITDSILELLTSLDSKIYVYRQDKKFLTKDKNILKKFKLKITSLKKPDPQLQLKFANLYLDSIGVSNLKTNEINTILGKVESYQELINLFDLYKIAGLDKAILVEYLQPTEKPIFMQPFGIFASLKDYKKWFLNDDGEVQLYLSLALTKLMKTPKNPKRDKAIRIIVDTDLQIKTNQSLTASTWWNLCLFKLTKI